MVKKNLMRLLNPILGALYTLAKFIIHQNQMAVDDHGRIGEGEIGHNPWLQIRKVMTSVQVLAFQVIEGNHSWNLKAAISCRLRAAKLYTGPVDDYYQR